MDAIIVTPAVFCDVQYIYAFTFSQDLTYLSHFFNAIGEDVSDDNPLLGRRPQVHLDQNNVIKQHQVSHICHLHKIQKQIKDQGLILCYKPTFEQFTHTGTMDINGVYVCSI